MFAIIKSCAIERKTWIYFGITNKWFLAKTYFRLPSFSLTLTLSGASFGFFFIIIICIFRISCYDYCGWCQWLPNLLTRTSWSNLNAKLFYKAIPFVWKALTNSDRENIVQYIGRDKHSLHAQKPKTSERLKAKLFKTKLNETQKTKRIKIVYRIWCVYDYFSVFSNKYLSFPYAACTQSNRKCMCIWIQRLKLRVHIIQLVWCRCFFSLANSNAIL